MPRGDRVINKRQVNGLKLQRKKRQERKRVAAILGGVKKATTISYTRKVNEKKLKKKLKKIMLLQQNAGNVASASNDVMDVEPEMTANINTNKIDEIMAQDTNMQVETVKSGGTTLGRPKTQ